MTRKIVFALVILLLAMGMAACGTIEVTLADEDDQESSPAGEVDSGQDSSPSPAPSATIVAATATSLVEPEATLDTPEPLPVETVAPPPAVQVAPAEWQRFYDDEFGIELWHPAGTIAEPGELARPEFWSEAFPDGIVEEQVFVIRVMQEEGGPLGPPGQQAILEVKLVANPEGKSLAVMADDFSKRCPGELFAQPEPTTVNVQLSGYRYSCAGMMDFSEFWSPYPADPQLIFGASWSDLSAPLSEEILATIAFDR